MRLTIYKKMMFGFLTVIVLMSGLGAYMVYELDAVSNAAQITLTSDVQSIDMAKQLRIPLSDENASAQKYLVSHDDAYFTVFSEASFRFSNDLDSLIGIQSDPKKLEVLQLVRNKNNAFAGAVCAEQALAATSSKKYTSSFDRSEFQSIPFINDELDRFVRMNQTSIDRAMASVGRTTEKSAGIALLLTLGALLLAITIAFFITRTITRPIAAVIEGTQQIAHGSFEPVKVASHDETALLARAVNDMSDQLKQINEYKASTMRQISHELRTPLQTILSAQYILSEQKLGRLNPEQLRLLGSMRGNIDKLIRFTNGFLDIAKIEAGKMEYEMVLADLLSIVASAVEDAQVLAEQRGIKIAVSASPIPYIMGDVEKLSLTFGNLISNAIKYSGKGGTIDITVTRHKGGARVSIADTGIGISSEDLSKIFARFYQASNASKAGVRGTGLGLALVKAFVEGHGGAVGVTSVLGSGSTFTVDLPAADLGTMAPSSPVVAQSRELDDGPT